MKKIILFKLFFFTSLFIYSQITPSLPDEKAMYEESMSKKYPNLNYSYDKKSKTHDYSNNWDIDGDFDTDSIMFVGNDAAHVNYHLRIKLSSENKVRDYYFLLTDVPFFYGEISALKNASFYPPPNFPVFVCYDFDEDGVNEIYLHILEVYSDKFKKRLSDLKIYSSYILIDFKNNELRILNFLD